MSLEYRLRQSGAEVQAAIDKIIALEPGALDAIGILCYDAAYWEEHASDIPALGALLIYNGVEGGQFKIGNGETSVADLPFVGAGLAQTVIAHIHDDVRHITMQERQNWNNKSDFSGRYQDLTGKPYIPTKLSDLSEDATHRTVTDNDKQLWNAKVDKSVNDLVNYYLKSETYTRTEVNALIGAIQRFHYEIYASLQEVTSPATNVLYLIGPTGSGSDKYEEYVYSTEFVKIGDTSIDLADYATKAELSQLGQEVDEKVNIDPSIDRINISSVGVASNYALVGDGKARSENGFECRKYAVSEGDVLYLKLSKDSGVDCVCQFQNTASISTSQVGNCIAQPVLTAIDGCVIVPRYATHLIVCCATGNTTNKVQKCTNIRDIEYGENIGITESIPSHNLVFEKGGKRFFIKQSYEQGTISECAVDGGTAITKTDVKESTLSDTFLNAFISNEISTEEIERKYGWTRGVIVSSTTYYTQIVNIFHDKYYYIKAYSIANKASLTLYDADGNLIDITNNDVNGCFKFPENVHHIAVSALVGNWSYVEIAQVNVADYVFPVTKVNGLDERLAILESGKMDIDSVNVVNPNDTEENKAIYIYNGAYEIRTMSGYSLSGFIPVKGQNIASNAVNNNTYWGHAVYNAKKEKIRTFNGKNYTYQEGDVFVRFSFGATETANQTQMANYGNSVKNYEPYNPISKYLPPKNIIGLAQVASGKTFSEDSYLSEIEAQPIVNRQGDYFVGYSEVTKSKQDKRFRRIVAINHDDLPQADYIATRKIYNKYGFNASFCFILQPFFNASHKAGMIDGVRRMLAEGHEMGLHAIMDSSYWRANKMVDVTPDGGSNFAPQYSDLIGHNQDKTGVNNYAQSITETTKLTALGYANPSTNLTVVNMTEAELNEVNASYNFYGNDRTMTGLDENDTEQTKKHLSWLEYWYNLWIDNTLGNSSNEATIAGRFAEDYSVPTGSSASDYYPDAEHLFSGKMVYWGDTTNAHFAEAKLKTAEGFSEDDYQLVGKFTKGLYKDCFSTANYEVMDRVIEIAQEFARRYFGLDHFTDTHIHGVAYINIQDGLFLRNKGFVVGGFGEFYRSRIGAYSSEISLLNEYGINLIDYDQNTIFYNGQVGLYYGQGGRLDTRVSSGRSTTGVFVSYLNFFGDNVSENMSYQNFIGFVNGLDNWKKFAYENAGKQVSRNGYTYTVFSAFKDCVDIIRSTFGTGKIPVLSLDTLGANPSIVAAIGMLCDYCKRNDVDIVSLAEARRLAMENGAKNNYFPNSAFIQSLLLDFGGVSQSNEAYIPDGWRKITMAQDATISVTDKALSMNGESVLETRIYGLPSGQYKLSFYASGNDATIKCFARKNGDSWSVTNVTPDYAPTLDGTLTLYEYTFTIDENTRKAVSSSSVSKICNGYEDNFSNLQIRIASGVNGTLVLASPTLKLI